MQVPSGPALPHCIFWKEGTFSNIQPVSLPFQFSETLNSGRDISANPTWAWAWLVLTTILILQIFYLVKRCPLCQTFGNGYNTGSCKETFCDCSTIFWVNLPLSIYVLCRTYTYLISFDRKFSKTHPFWNRINKSFFKRKIQRWKSSLILLLTINKLHRVLKIVLVTPPRAMHLKYFRAFDT